MTMPSSLIVLFACLAGDFTQGFLACAACGVIIACFVHDRGKLLRPSLLLLLVYAVSEFFATVVCHGHMTGFPAVILGMLSLGLAVGLLLSWVAATLWGRRRKRT